MVNDIWSGPDSGMPSNLTNVNGVLYFGANDGVNGQELWKSDGTADGTVLVKNIYPGPGSGSPTSLTSINDVLYFTANDGVNGYELWKSDGTSSGTVIISDIVAGNQSSFPSKPFAFKNKFYFSAIDNNGIFNLWESDGTDIGTKIVFNGDLVVARSYLFTSINDVLYFYGSIDNSGGELLKYISVITDVTLERRTLTDILVYPNPSNGQITIEYNNDGADAKFYLLDLTGKKILEKEMTPDTMQINLIGIIPGIYFYQICSGRFIYNGKIILK